MRFGASWETRFGRSDIPGRKQSRQERKHRVAGLNGGRNIGRRSEEEEASERDGSCLRIAHYGFGVRAEQGPECDQTEGRKEGKCSELRGCSGAEQHEGQV